MKTILGDDIPDEKEIAFAGLSGKAAKESEIRLEASASDMTADIMSSVLRSQTRSEQVIDRVEDEGPSMDM